MSKITNYGLTGLLCE